MNKLKPLKRYRLKAKLNNLYKLLYNSPQLIAQYEKYYESKIKERQEEINKQQEAMYKKYPSAFLEEIERREALTIERKEWFQSALYKLYQAINKQYKTMDKTAEALEALYTEHQDLFTAAGVKSYVDIEKNNATYHNHKQ